jgi:hypothetical protein
MTKTIFYHGFDYEGILLPKRGFIFTLTLLPKDPKTKSTQAKP